MPVSTSVQPVVAAEQVAVDVPDPERERECEPGDAGCDLLHRHIQTVRLQVP